MDVPIFSFTCKECGKEKQTHKGNLKYCNEKCRKEYKRKHRQGYKPPEKKENLTFTTCPKCSANLLYKFAGGKVCHGENCNYIE